MRNNWEVVVFALSVHLVIGLARGQQQYYDEHYQAPSSNQNSYGRASDYGGGAGGDYSSGSDYGNEGRPKLQLGLRVKIPAMKFELPRMSLPKITISAKIRQPNRPRTINLPEINLDTSSRVAAPKGSQMADGNGNYNRQPAYMAGGGSQGAYGGYAASASSYNQQESSYGSSSPDYGPAKTQTFSISTSGEEEPPARGAYGQNYQYQHYQQQPQQQQQYQNYQQKSSPPVYRNMNSNIDYSSSETEPISLHPDNEFFINQLPYKQTQPTTFNEPLERATSSKGNSRGLYRIIRMFRPNP